MFPNIPAVHTITIHKNAIKNIGYQLFIFSSEVVYSAEVPGPPSCLQLFYNDGGEKGDQVPFRRPVTWTCSFLVPLKEHNRSQDIMYY